MDEMKENKAKIDDKNQNNGRLVRRRPTVRALTDSADDEEGSGSVALFTNKIFVTPCLGKISNDPFDDNATTIRDAPECEEITSYICPMEEDNEDSTDGEGEVTVMENEPREVVVPFDFEVVYDARVNLEETLGSLESLYLRQLAYFTGLLSCSSPVISTTARYHGKYRSRSRLLQQFTDSEKNLLIGIKGEPSDEVDPNYSCMVPLQSSLKDGSECAAVNGGLTVLVNPSATSEEEDGIKAGMLEAIREGMIGDVYVGRGIRKVSFIGTRLQFDDDELLSPAPSSDSIVGGARGSPNNDDPASNGISPWAIGFIVTGTVLVVIFAALLAYRKRRNNRHSNMIEDAIFVDATVQANEISADPIIEAGKGSELSDLTPVINATEEEGDTTTIGDTMVNETLSTGITLSTGMDEDESIDEEVSRTSANDAAAVTLSYSGSSEEQQTIDQLHVLSETEETFSVAASDDGSNSTRPLV
mmetsp:Transcript_28511/g.43105  ORF Transcript_28511/g.43105 Transcript_28511/m.43105 type:complete len:474 (-) Transcript_28511:40-1461(-)|eukprot:CAMPEP_0178922784 /NCGR_PEP_ID=MMETSP0786-20121207/16349_1 /TAXON_ID=186022 /ORGANISM="Thalassionema frauenfeldii, Strain CCMP 1798" /LENGTH=473 /DNA_ID=CAMNT_0020597193 /DNA_START=119 /DNA_END=1540 /DNA_ORIENTATION=+